MSTLFTIGLCIISYDFQVQWSYSTTKNLQFFYLIIVGIVQCDSKQTNQVLLPTILSNFSQSSSKLRRCEFFLRTFSKTQDYKEQNNQFDVIF